MALNSQGYPIWNVGNMNQKGYNTSDKSVYNNFDTKQDNINMNPNVYSWDYSINGMDASKSQSVLDAITNRKQIPYSGNDLVSIMKNGGFNIIDPNSTVGVWSQLDNSEINLKGLDRDSLKIYTRAGKISNDGKIAAEGIVIIADGNGNYQMASNQTTFYKDVLKSQYEIRSDNTSGGITTKDGDKYYKDKVLYSTNWDNSKNLNHAQDIETIKEEPEIKMTSEQLVDYKTLYELNNTIRDTTYDNERKTFASNELLNYSNGMRVSLNIAPINRYNTSSYVTSSEYSKRLSYILGDNQFLRTLFGNTNGLIFPYTPQISMQHNVNYEEVEILHSNLTYQYYKNTPPPGISINADFTADTPENALYMLGTIWFLRAMTKSDFGKKANRGENKNYAGMPPPVLYLNGYGKMYDNIPVIIKFFDTPFQKDKHYVNVKVDENGDWKVNYLNNFDTVVYNDMKNIIYDEWLPTEMTINITLAVQPNLKKVKDQFDLDSYKKGILGNVIKNSSGSSNLDKSTLYNGSGWTW